jgi:hypothetical protein
VRSVQWPIPDLFFHLQLCQNFHNCFQFSHHRGVFHSSSHSSRPGAVLGAAKLDAGHSLLLPRGLTSYQSSVSHHRPVDELFVHSYEPDNWRRPSSVACALIFLLQSARFGNMHGSHNFSRETVAHVGWEDEPQTIQQNPHNELRHSIMTDIRPLGEVLICPCNTSQDTFHRRQSRTHSREGSC